MTQPWSKDAAIAIFNMANLYRTVHEKILYSAYVYTPTLADPALVKAADQKDNSFVDAVNSLNKIAAIMDSPNLLPNLQNLLNALEVVILPKFGVEVRGYIPLFRRPTAGRPGQIDCIRVGNQGSSTKEILDFGNFCDTKVSSDMKALEIASNSIKDLAPNIKLSGLGQGGPAEAIFTVALITWLIKAAAVLVITTVVVGGGLLVIGKIGDALSPPWKDPAWQDWAEKHPDQAKAMQSWWEQASTAIMWLAIGLGTVAIAWGVSSITGVFRNT